MDFLLYGISARAHKKKANLVGCNLVLHAEDDIIITKCYPGPLKLKKKKIVIHEVATLQQLAKHILVSGNLLYRKQNFKEKEGFEFAELRIQIDM